MSEGWTQIPDPAMHARITAAVRLVLDHTDPRAIHAEKAEDGSDCRDALYDSNGTAAYGWSLYEGSNPEKGSPFCRADRTRASDGCGTAIAADSDGRTVLFIDELGATAEEAVSALERFARHVAGRS